MNVVRKLQRKIEKQQEKIEVLSAENICFLMENEALKEKTQSWKKKKIYSVKPKKFGTKKKCGRKSRFKGTSRKKPDHIDLRLEIWALWALKIRSLNKEIGF